MYKFKSVYIISEDKKYVNTNDLPVVKEAKFLNYEEAHLWLKEAGIHYYMFTLAKEE